MITTLFFYIVGLFTSIIAIILPDVQLWPQVVFDFQTAAIDKIMTLRYLFFFIPDVLEAFNWFLFFLNWLLVFIIARRVFNYARGTGEGM